MRTKIGQGEAESEGCGGSTVEEDNEAWPDLRRNPEGWGQFPHFSVARRSKILRVRHFSILQPREFGTQRRPWES